MNYGKVWALRQGRARPKRTGALCEVKNKMKTTTTKPTLLASSPSLEKLTHQVSRYYLGNTSVILEKEGGISRCLNGERSTFEDVFWKQKGNRFYFYTTAY